jgi:CYTH domain-containing protein
MDKRARYAKPEYERRFLLDELPEGLLSSTRIRDRYLRDTRLRLRRVETTAGELIELKLGHKRRPEAGDARVILHTSLFLDETEFEILRGLPGYDLIKTRYRLDQQLDWAVDRHESPHADLVVLEVNFRDLAEAEVFEPPVWASREVTQDEAYTGGELARARH